MGATDPRRQTGVLDQVEWLDWYIQVGLHRPWRLCVDEPSGCLYVCDRNNNRVLRYRLANLRDKGQYESRSQSQSMKLKVETEVVLEGAGIAKVGRVGSEAPSKLGNESKNWMLLNQPVDVAVGQDPLCPNRHGIFSFGCLVSSETIADPTTRWIGDKSQLRFFMFKR